MKAKTFIFNRLSKNTKTIEDDINSFLKDNTFRFVTHVEGSKKTKLVVNLFHEPKKDEELIQVKAFRNISPEAMESDVNDFLEKVDFKFATQSYGQSNTFLLVFYTKKGRKTNGGKKTK